MEFHCRKLDRNLSAVEHCLLSLSLASRSVALSGTATLRSFPITKVDSTVTFEDSTLDDPSAAGIRSSSNFSADSLSGNDMSHHHSLQSLSPSRSSATITGSPVIVNVRDDAALVLILESQADVEKMITTLARMASAPTLSSSSTLGSSNAVAAILPGPTVKLIHYTMPANLWTFDSFARYLGDSDGLGYIKWKADTPVNPLIPFPSTRLDFLQLSLNKSVMQRLSATRDTFLEFTSSVVPVAGHVMERHTQNTNGSGIGFVAEVLPILTYICQCTYHKELAKVPAIAYPTAAHVDPNVVGALWHSDAAIILSDKALYLTERTGRVLERIALADCDLLLLPPQQQAPSSRAGSSSAAPSSAGSSGLDGVAAIDDVAVLIYNNRTECACLKSKYVRDIAHRLRQVVPHKIAPSSSTDVRGRLDLEIASGRLASQQQQALPVPITFDAMADSFPSQSQVRGQSVGASQPQPFAADNLDRMRSTSAGGPPMRSSSVGSALFFPLDAADRNAAWTQTADPDAVKVAATTAQLVGLGESSHRREPSSAANTAGDTKTRRSSGPEKPKDKDADAGAAGQQQRRPSASSPPGNKDRKTQDPPQTSGTQKPFAPAHRGVSTQREGSAEVINMRGDDDDAAIGTAAPPHPTSKRASYVAAPDRSASTRSQPAEVADDGNSQREAQDLGAETPAGYAAIIYSLQRKVEDLQTTVKHRDITINLLHQRCQQLALEGPNGGLAGAEGSFSNNGSFTPRSVGGRTKSPKPSASRADGAKGPLIVGRNAPPLKRTASGANTPRGGALPLDPESLNPTASAAATTNQLDVLRHYVLLLEEQIQSEQSQREFQERKMTKLEAQLAELVLKEEEQGQILAKAGLHGDAGKPSGTTGKDATIAALRLAFDEAVYREMMNQNRLRRVQQEQKAVLDSSNAALSEMGLKVANEIQSFVMNYHQSQRQLQHQRGDGRGGEQDPRAISDIRTWADFVLKVEMVEHKILDEVQHRTKDLASSNASLLQELRAREAQVDDLTQQVLSHSGLVQPLEVLQGIKTAVEELNQKKSAMEQKVRSLERQVEDLTRARNALITEDEPDVVSILSERDPHGPKRVTADVLRQQVLALERLNSVPLLIHRLATLEVLASERDGAKDLAASKEKETKELSQQLRQSRDQVKHLKEDLEAAKRSATDAEGFLRDSRLEVERLHNKISELRDEKDALERSLKKQIRYQKDRIHDLIHAAKNGGGAPVHAANGDAYHPDVSPYGHGSGRPGGLDFSGLGFANTDEGGTPRPPIYQRMSEVSAGASAAATTATKPGAGRVSPSTSSRAGTRPAVSSTPASTVSTPRAGNRGTMPSSARTNQPATHNTSAAPLALDAYRENRLHSIQQALSAIGSQHPSWGVDPNAAAPESLVAPLQSNGAKTQEQLSALAEENAALRRIVETQESRLEARLSEMLQAAIGPGATPGTSASTRQQHRVDVSPAAMNPRSAGGVPHQQGYHGREPTVSTPRQKSQPSAHSATPAPDEPEQEAVFGVVRDSQTVMGNYDPRAEMERLEQRAKKLHHDVRVDRAEDDALRREARKVVLGAKPSAATGPNAQRGAVVSHAKRPHNPNYVPQESSRRRSSSNQRLGSEQHPRRSASRDSMDSTRSGSGSNQAHRSSSRGLPEEDLAPSSRSNSTLDAARERIEELKRRQILH
jgi:hypothetical protein